MIHHSRGKHHDARVHPPITRVAHQDGASAVEYGLLVAGIAALIVAIVFVFGGVIKSAFAQDRRRRAPSTRAAPSATC